MNNYIIIPTRLKSTRLPQKMLLKETGKYLIQHTWENVKRQCENWAEIYIATEDLEIFNICKNFGADVIQTNRASCGTERMWLVSKELGQGNYINIQGDLPNIDLSIFPDGLIALIHSDIIGLHYVMQTPQKVDYNRTKVVLGHDNDVLYYSREQIPHKSPIININIGVYTMSNKVLNYIYGDKSNESHSINTTENLEQLRWLEIGFSITSFKTKQAISIDTKEDYERFRNCTT